ncbi:hypothetical protein ACFVGM_14930 [Kitasatospora purpeofusca]|uniref:hypothetical protein n=1 Tax=Kitasatospora purpeofusca TaxID=67352 RepID=UPI0036D1F116
MAETAEVASDGKAGTASAESTDVVSGAAGVVGRGAAGPARRRRTRVIASGAAVALAAVAVGAVVLLGRDGDPVVEQTLCGLPRASGTPLDSLLPRGRAGVEGSSETRGDGDATSVRTCTITVDGTEALTIRVMATKADSAGSSGGRAGDRAGRGVVVSRGSATVADLCRSDPGRVAFASVQVDLGLLAPKADGAANEAQQRATAELVESMRAELGQALCG